MVKAGRTLRNLLYTGAFVLASALIPACNSCEKENSPPEAKLEVNPKTGETPLEVRMKVTGTDLDGPKDIHWYNLNINNQKIERNYPIDTVITFTESGIARVYGEVIDSRNQKNRTAETSIEIYGKHFIDQSASLIDDINVKYDATLFRVSEADLIVEREGTQILTKKITDVNQTGKDYEKTFTPSDGLTKGNHKFKLKTGDLEKETSVDIPNYKPTMPSITPVNFLEETDTTITLPTPTDKNPEDINNIAYQSAVSLDGKTQATLLAGNKLKISGLSKQTGNYSVKLIFGSTAGGLEEAILSGNIIKDTRMKINLFTQPNDSTLNWYGSGDTNNDNIVNSQDVTRIIEIINGTYTNPSDLRLKDRADVNGDKIVDNSDKQLIENKVNGIILYLPGEWNKLTTRTERESWLTKMLVIDEVNTTPLPGGDCNQFALQLYINFHGVSNPTDITRFLETYNYNFSKNGRFNLPVNEVLVPYYDANGNPTGEGHAMNNIILDNNALNWNELSNIEPQFDQINIQPGQAYLTTNCNFIVRGVPTSSRIGDNPNLTVYFYYNIRNGNPGEGISLQGNYPNLKIIYQR